MDSVIDSLLLKIDIDVEKGIDKTISHLAKSIVQINKAVASADVKGLKTYVNTLSKFTTTNIKVSMPSVSVGNLGNVSEIKNVLETTKVSMDSTSESISQAKELASKLRVKVSENTKAFKEMRKELGNTGRSSNKASKDIDKTSKSFSKLLRSVGRIAFYRAIRMALSQIFNAFKQGVNNIRSVDKELDSALGNISNSATSIQNSLGAMVAPLIKTVQPVITQISDGIARFANMISEANASLSGESTYTKILTSDTKEWQEQLEKVEGSLLSFDKFEALSNKENSYTGTVEAPVEMPQEEAENFLATLKSVLYVVGAIGIAIAGLKIISLIQSVKKLGGLLSPKSLGLGLVVAGVIELVSGIKDFINLIKNGGSEIEWLSASLKVLAGALTLTMGILMFTKLTTAKTIVGMIAGFATVGSLIASAVASSQSASKQVQAYADGGNFSQGTMFYAGEAGAEIVYNKRTGSTSGGVLNIEQFTTAMVDALTIYGASQGNMRDLSGMGVYIDKTKAGQVLESSVYGEGVRVGHFSRR